MNKIQAKKVLQMLDRIGQEIDILGNTILNNSLKPVPVSLNNTEKFRIK